MRTWSPVLKYHSHIVRDCGYGVYEHLESVSTKAAAMTWVMTALKNKVIKPDDRVIVIDSIGRNRFSVGIVAMHPHAVYERPQQLSLFERR